MKKDIISAILVTFCLTVLLFTVFPTRSLLSVGGYDPWLDINDDGKIDMKDVSSVARAFGATGDAVVKASIEYDSGWIDITDKAGQNIIVTHGFGSMDVMVDITGRTTRDGGIHQKQIGGEDYTEMWNQTYGGAGSESAFSLVQTVDGGYALSGGTNSSGAGIYDFWLVKTDASGNVEWNQTYGGIGEEVAFSLVQTMDGGYALTGYTTSYGAGGFDFWLVKTDASGNVEWNQTYGGIEWDTARSLVQTSDGGYVLAGDTNSFGAGNADFWLVKTDASGNVEWNQTYGGINGDIGMFMVQTVDGGYALTGYTRSYGAGNWDFWLVKTDASGNVEWNQTYGGTGADFGTAVVQTVDGGYALTGHTRSYGAGINDAWLVKTDASGNVEWNQTYGGIDTERAYSLVQTVDGGYALTGHTNSYGAGIYDAWLVKTDASGNVEWNQTYGGTGEEWMWSLVQTVDGGYVLAGDTTSYGAGIIDAWLLKTDSNGNILTGLFKYGLAWIDSTLDSITLHKGIYDSYWNFVRVRLWEIKNP